MSKMDKLHQVTSTIVLILIYLELVHIAQTSAHKHKNDKMAILEGGGSTSICGASLVHYLQITCNNKFYAMYKPMSKRSEDADLDLELDYLTALYEDESSTFPFRNRPMAKALIPGSLRRAKRGIVDECCKKSCTLSEMKGYCRP